MEKLMSAIQVSKTKKAEKHNPKPLETFHPFARLPTELQNKIWGYAILNSREFGRVILLEGKASEKLPMHAGPGTYLAGRTGRRTDESDPRFTVNNFRHHDDVFDYPNSSYGFGYMDYENSFRENEEDPAELLTVDNGLGFYFHGHEGAASSNAGFHNGVIFLSKNPVPTLANVCSDVRDMALEGTELLFPDRSEHCAIRMDFETDSLLITRVMLCHYLPSLKAVIPEDTRRNIKNVAVEFEMSFTDWLNPDFNPWKTMPHADEMSELFEVFHSIRDLILIPCDNLSTEGSHLNRGELKIVKPDWESKTWVRRERYLGEAKRWYQICASRPSRFIYGELVTVKGEQK